jgi:hypothetical protein
LHLTLTRQKISFRKRKVGTLEMSSDHPIVSTPAPVLESKIRTNGILSRVSEWNVRHPVAAIVCMALLAVSINCHPIIFFGKSFVSPMSIGNPMVYSWWPPLPGMERWPGPTRTAGWPEQTAAVLNNMHGSDTGAMMWWGVPVGFIESRSLWKHGEIPLWNRYSHAGDTLIGQAVTMLGDPLQLIVLAGQGSAVAWDVKFLVAKILFCTGFGLLIRRLLKTPPLSLIFTALAAYCGAFFYINNHPAFFVFAYAPWILLAGIEWLDPQSERRIGWGLAWLLANFSCFNAGHVEAAVVLIGGLNLAAIAYQFILQRSIAASAKILGRMAIGTLLFLGLTAPVWLSFLAALDGSYTAHEKIEVRQLPITSLPGAFDDLFFLLLRADDSINAIAPGTSLLALVGCGFSLLRWRQLKAEPFFWVNLGAIGLWGGIVFGMVPASLLAIVPMLNRVGHIYTDFSYLLVIHLTIQSAYGFLCLTKVDKLRQVAVDFAGLGGIFAGLFVLYAHGYRHHPIPWDYVLCAAAGAVGAPLLFVFLKRRQRQTWVVGWAGIIVLGFIPNFRFGLYNLGDDALLMLPGPRLVLNPPSPAVDKIKADKAEPFRVVGLEWNFMGDYSAVYELEDIRSCAPLSNGEFVNLLRHFPGVELTKDWEVEIVDPARAQPLLNLLNVKYLLSWPDVGLRQQLAFRIIDRSDFGVLENLQAWPRAFFANQVVSIASSEEFIQHLLENNRQPFVALTQTEIEKQPGLQRLETIVPAAISPATHYRLLPNATEFDVHASSAGVVCLTEGQAKDFTATANKQPKAVLTINRAFKGIYLDQPGDYHVQFTYRPRHWRLACTLFWMAIGGSILLALMSRFCVNAAVKSRAAPSIEGHEPNRISSN